jgi:hypothetical protein
MVEIYKAPNGAKVYVGDNDDYDKIKDKDDFRSARMCKYMTGGHKETLGYTSPAAPKGPNYLHVKADNRIAVNILDLHDPNMIPFECITVALDYIEDQLEKGKNVLVACNSGCSRGPSTGMAFLRSIGELPYNFHRSEQVYKTLYPKYSPGMGIRQVMRDNWSALDNMETNNGRQEKEQRT